MLTHFLVQLLRVAPVRAHSLGEQRTKECLSEFGFPALEPGSTKGDAKVREGFHYVLIQDEVFKAVDPFLGNDLRATKVVYDRFLFFTEPPVAVIEVSVQKSVLK